MHTDKLSYACDGQEFVGYVAYEDGPSETRPVVMIAHAFEGCNELMQQHARDMATKGYIGFAIDMYGQGVVADSLESCMEHMMPCFNDRALLRDRITAAFEAAKQIPGADPKRIYAVGFCFGGMCVLDLARGGADVAAVASVHGVLSAPADANAAITARVLALHGYQDPQIPQADLTAFAEEMTAAGVDWQLHYFGSAKHAFTDPRADQIGEPEMGRVYDPVATARSWAMIESLLAESV
jgi:dienelactone hydrolase